MQFNKVLQFQNRKSLKIEV